MYLVCGKSYVVIVSLFLDCGVSLISINGWGYDCLEVVVKVGVFDVVMIIVKYKRLVFVLEDFDENNVIKINIIIYFWYYLISVWC